LRPFEIVLLEVVPAGQQPSLNRQFAVEPIPTRFAEASQPVDLTIATNRVEHVSDEDSPWQILESVTAVSANGAVLTRQADHSLLVSGKNATPETYTVTASTDLKGITAVRLEALPDPSLPGRGPGRVFNGNIVLSEFRVSAAPQNDPAAAKPVALHHAIADFSQEAAGGWPVAAAIDGDPQTGWSIDPEEGAPHEAIFETKEPVGFSGGTKFTFVLDQVTPPDHTLGRFRLAVTSAAKPPLNPSVSSKPQWLVSGQAPPCPKGGTLVISAELSVDGKPFTFHDAQTRLRCRGVLAGQEISGEPVLHSPSPYPASWQAWRIKLNPATVPQLFEFRVAFQAPAAAKFNFQGHYIPVEHP
jgi:hypothetical protein